jgi:hypothetical protein
MKLRNIFFAAVLLLSTFKLSAQDWQDADNHVVFPQATQKFRGCDSVVTYQNATVYDRTVSKLNQDGYLWILTNYNGSVVNDSYVVTYSNNQYTRVDRYFDPDWIVEELKATYNSSNQIIRETVRYDIHETGLENSGRYWYTYDTSGLMCTRMYEDWKTKEFGQWPDTAWVPQQLDSFFYSGGRILKELSYGLDTATKTWLIFERGAFTYNTNGDLTYVLWELYNRPAQAWQNRQREYYTYSASKALIAKKIDHWDENTSAWMDNEIDSMKMVNGVEHTITYRAGRGSWMEYEGSFCGGSLLPLGILKQSEPIVSVYPNPATTHLTISRGNPQPATMSIYTSTGQIVLSTRVNAATTTIDISNLKPGVYFYRLSDESESSSGVVMKAGE